MKFPVSNGYSTANNIKTDPDPNQVLEMPHKHRPPRTISPVHHPRSFNEPCPLQQNYFFDMPQRCRSGLLDDNDDDSDDDSDLPFDMSPPRTVSPAHPPRSSAKLHLLQ